MYAKVKLEGERNSISYGGGQTLLENTGKQTL